MSAIALFTVVLMGQITPRVPHECGPPPVFTEGLPDAQTATRGDLEVARDAVRTYSAQVSEWLTCKDRRSQLVFSWMTEEQQTRWTNDTNAVHNARVDVEKSLNERIRAYNARLDREALDSPST